MSARKSRGSGGRKSKGKGGTRKGIKKFGPPDEETPITVSGGSIKVDFDRDFKENKPSSTKTIRNVKHPSPTVRFTRLIISLGELEEDGSNILAQYALNQDCFVYIRGIS